MLQKGQWIILPYANIWDLENLWLSPLGVVLQQDHWPHTIADYTFSSIKADTIPLMAHLEMQFSQALPCILGPSCTAIPPMAQST